MGFDYISSANNSIGLEYQLTETNLPNLELNATTLVDNHYLQESISALVSWQLSPKTRIEGNMGYTKNTFKMFSARNFSGYTGKMALTWDVTAKTTVILSAWRQLITAADITANYLTGQGAGIAPTWKITEKLKLLAGVSWESQIYEGDPGLVNGAILRKDEILSGQVGLKYTPVRNADIELIYRSEKRLSNRLGADYGYASVFANVMFKF